MNRTAKQWLESRFGSLVRFNEPMARHTSLQIGGPAEAFLLPERFEDVSALIVWAGDHRIPCTIVGGGTNILVTDAGIPGIVIGMKRCLSRVIRTEIRNDSILVTAGAGMDLQKLCWYAIRQGWGGVTFAMGIPGTLGGAIMMNAGTRAGAVEGILQRVTVLMPDGRINRLDRSDLIFQYRQLVFERDKEQGPSDPVIVEADLVFHLSDPVQLRITAREMLRMRRNTQPSGVASAGCFFKNPAAGRSAGEWIDLAGLKGTSVGGAEVSATHANFFINRGNATCADMMALMSLVQKRVLAMSGILLETEVKRIGF